MYGHCLGFVLFAIRLLWPLLDNHAFDPFFYSLGLFLLPHQRLLHSLHLLLAEPLHKFTSLLNSFLVLFALLLPFLAVVHEFDALHD